MLALFKLRTPYDVNGIDTQTVSGRKHKRKKTTVRNKMSLMGDRRSCYEAESSGSVDLDININAPKKRAFA